MSDRLLVGGVVSLTTVDYPDHLASVVFLQGCTWRCVYCHNPHLQVILPEESLPWEDILSLLRTRQGFVEAVVFSGGEPLFQKSLLPAIKDVRELGFKVGLHTSGAFPDKLSQVVPFVDWIGFDVKQSFENYHLITGVPGSGKAALESLELIVASNVDFEVRMTLYKDISTDSIVETLKEISQLGVRKVALQKCRDKDENVVEHPLFSDKILLENLSSYFDSFYVRG